ncbi:HAD family hydrolase [Meiothermus taiwanensis]|jgi:HAD superfamily phosphoserine phosphatase-like hydrolase|uniref:Phosphoserine phosphatase SerB1 n=2 Tax=Meiothermus taiwanensis TaxID=172827 RepID=A0A399E339_9DEIN|nr:HAD-IB family phosphatase [Meiothermus taiwanensis]AWR85343.1 HAD-superfamily subfamily IB hydrolase, TIGR01490 [Meiothermus taiwanensis WR-220]KIQ55811.1 HAD family hydrolase [Meiothermus taiwanensis]KZK15890.1 HAD family hydrolase [Meiothermus taiwanensis]RIH76631.1 Phosphoserine phosphatase SerB1 [Meiothermus taiwanensis]
MNTIAADLEGTLTTGETWRGLAAWMQAHGRAAQYQWFFYRNLPGAVAARLGLQDRRAFQDRFMEGAAGLLAGLGQAELAAVSEWVVTNELWPKRRQDVLDELLRLRQDGRRLVLCSATFQPILEAFARRMGEGVVALGTPLEVEGGVFTGRLRGPVRSGAHKAEHLRKLLDGEVLYRAYGDSLPDLAMLELAEEPVAVYPEPRLRELALQRNWRVIG